MTFSLSDTQGNSRTALKHNNRNDLPFLPKSIADTTELGRGRVTLVARVFVVRFGSSIETLGQF